MTLDILLRYWIFYYDTRYFVKTLDILSYWIFFYHTRYFVKTLDIL